MTDDLAARRAHPEATRLDAETVRAVDLVVDANADLELWYAIGLGVLEGRRSSMQRFARRSGSREVVPSLVADDLVAVTADDAVELCRGFCRREPQTVLNHLTAEEHRIDAGGDAPGGVELARRARTLVRSWTEGA